MLAIGCTGLVWGITALPRSEASDDFRDIGARLLRQERFNRPALTRKMETAAAQSLSPCDTHSQRTMLLIEMPLAEAALRTGLVQDFDRHIHSLETRSRNILSCTPRDSFVWLVMFTLETLHGRLDERSFAALDMSYETAPSEAWIGIRRIGVAVSQLLVAPEPLRQKILDEFQQLIKDGFADNAAHSYLAASQPIRALLMARVEQLDPEQQKHFSESVKQLRS